MEDHPDICCPACGAPLGEQLISPVGGQTEIAYRTTCPYCQTVVGDELTEGMGERSLRMIMQVDGELSPASPVECQSQIHLLLPVEALAAEGIDWDTMEDWMDKMEVALTETVESGLTALQALRQK